MRRVDDEHISPLDEFLQNLLGAWRLQIQRQAALVAVGEVPLVGDVGLRLRGDLVGVPPRIAVRGFDLDHIGAKVAEDHRGSGGGDEGRQIHDFQAGKDVVVRHRIFLSGLSGRRLQRPRKWGARLPRKAEIPSALSSVAAHRPKTDASRAKPSAWLVSRPLFTASRAYLTPSGALAAISLRIASARGIRLAAGTTSLTSPMRQASWASIIPPPRMSWSARPLPTRRGSLWVPPPPGNNPSLTSGWPNLACSTAMRRVQAIAVSQPPPRAKPLIAATTGLPRFSTRSRTSCPARLDCSASTAVKCASSLMSAPATKALSPAPVTMTPRTVSSSRASSKAVRRSAQVALLRAFSTFGRLIVTYAMASLFS